MRLKPTLLDLDISAWPTVAHTELSAADREAFDKRREAVERYVHGDSIQAIEQATGINRRQLYRWLERCLVQHEDGRLYGFRALICQQRIVAYTRITKVTVQGERGSRGTVGALLQLFEPYPGLRVWLIQQIKLRRVILEELGTDACRSVARSA